MPLPKNGEVRGSLERIEKEERKVKRKDRKKVKDESEATLPLKCSASREKKERKVVERKRKIKEKRKEKVEETNPLIMQMTQMVKIDERAIVYKKI